MKELSIEQKAKAYDEAYKRVAIRFGSNVADEIFPELKESEDERIKENIIATIHLYYGEPLEDEAEEMIAWLESQGEQNPAWSLEDEVKINRIVACLENLNVADNDILLKDVAWLKFLKERVQPQPKQKWSEEDDKMLSQVINEIEAIKSHSSTVFEKNIAQDKIDFLKSLKERYTWKPSDEQIKALDEVYKTHGANNVCRRVLFNLMNDLKKLREK